MARDVVKRCSILLIRSNESRRRILFPCTHKPRRKYHPQRPTTYGDVEQAIAEGATISYGYKSMREWIGLDVYTQQKGYFFPPTILTGLDDEEKFTICNSQFIS